MTQRSDRVRRFVFTAGRPPAGDWERLSGDDFLDRPERAASAASMSGGTDPIWARDFLEIARAAFLVDKRFRRAHTSDRWTRRIELVVDVRLPRTWNVEALRRVDALLNTLTGDEWRIGVREGGAPFEKPELPLEHRQPVEAVSLMSGGLDSACHAAARVREIGEGTLLLVSLVDRVRAPQKRVASAIKRIGGTVQTRHLDQRPRKASSEGLELSSRTRGFLYLAAAIHAAAAHGVLRVDVPENGQLAVNPPLTPARLGALSTRSVHPWTLHLLNDLIATIGGGITVVNPLLHLTKGEVCAGGLAAGLTESDLFATVSCGRHSNLGDRNCGSCLPCLVRRSGLLHAIGEDRTRYVRESIVGDDAKDLRAVRSWLARDFSERDLVADMPFPPDTTPRSLLPVLGRGRAELASMAEQLTAVRT